MVSTDNARCHYKVAPLLCKEYRQVNIDPKEVNYEVKEKSVRKLRVEHSKRVPGEGDDILRLIGGLAGRKHVALQP